MEALSIAGGRPPCVAVELLQTSVVDLACRNSYRWIAEVFSG